MEKKFICFIHIERAGGTTLHHLINYNYPFYVTLKPWYFWSNEEGNYLKKGELNCLKKILPILPGIGGHTTRTYANYESVIDKSIFYFTFLRNPVYRYISHFNYQRQVIGIEWEIEDFLNESKFNNYQVVRLAGEEDLEKARFVLEEKIDFVGLTERFDESLLLLKNKLNDKDFQINYERKNVTKEKKRTLHFEDLYEELQTKIKENNKLDIELYEYVVDKVYSRYKAEYPGNLQDDLNSFKEINKDFKYIKNKKIALKVYRNFTKYVIQPIVHEFCTQ